MTGLVYSSNNEEGLLKSVGPYRIAIADMSIVGVRLPRVIKLSAPVPFGAKKVYGSQSIIEKKSL